MTVMMLAMAVAPATESVESTVLQSRNQYCLNEKVYRALQHVLRVKARKACLRTQDLDLKKKYGLRKDVRKTCM